MGDTPIAFDSVGSNLNITNDVEDAMNQKIREYNRQKVKDAELAKIMVVIKDLVWLVSLVIFLGVGTAIYKYNQMIETECTGPLPSGFEAIEMLKVFNSTAQLDGTSLVVYQQGAAMTTMSSSVSLPSGNYATMPDTPVCYREWTTLEGFYFGMVTATTVGYGDYSPANDSMKAFTILYIALALVMAGSIIGICTRYVKSFQDFLLRLLDDNPDDLDEPQEYKVLLSVLLIVMTVVTGAVFFQFNEGWSFLDAFYWSFITSTTIGYGDMSLTKESSHIFSIFYLLMSTTFFAFGLGNVVGIQEEIRREEKRISVMHNNANVKKMLAGSVTGNISSGEYLAAYLFEMGVVGHDDVRPVLARFKELDADRSGFLDKNDLNFKDTRTPLQRQESMKRKMANIKRIESDMEAELSAQEKAAHGSESEIEKGEGVPSAVIDPDPYNY
jgi:voltage-gated potassium channel Kch